MVHNTHLLHIKSAGGVVNPNLSGGDMWNMVGSYETTKEMQLFDTWRREIKFESVDALIEMYKEVAKLQGVSAYDLINEDFNKWKRDRNKSKMAIT